MARNMLDYILAKCNTNQINACVLRARVHAAATALNCILFWPSDTIDEPITVKQLTEGYINTVESG